MLCVWLPLNGDLHNQGISNIGATAVGAIVNTNGKIGSCYYLSTNTDTIYTDLFTPETNNFSYCFWYRAADDNNTTGYIGGLSRASNPSIMLYKNGDTHLRLYLDSYTTYTHNLNIKQWHHYTITYNGADMMLYIDGTYATTRSKAYDFTTNTFRLFLGGRSNNSSTNGAISVHGGPCYFNDIRYYNHCLSAAEVGEISQGLVLHYKLDDLPGGNLIINGFGELGMENWNNSSRVSTDVPSENTSIKQSFYNQSTTIKVPIIQSHTYEFSCYVKAIDTTGSMYPSFQTYDLDDKIIRYYNEPDGFKTGTYTTLAQALHTGDTAIYAINLANWPDHTNNRYVAIFSYKDSTGHIYNDGEYTQNIISYGTSNNLNKTTGVITLSSAYSGPDMPAGTTICQSVGGGTYYYPMGGIAKSTIENWTFKNITFVPSTINRLKYAASILFIAGTTNDILISGIKLVDTTYTNKVIDSSGYNNNGTITGNISLSSNSSRYSDCIYIPSGDTDYIVTNETVGNPADAITMNIWAKTSAAPVGTDYHSFFNIATDTQPFEFAIYKTGYFRQGIKINGTRYIKNSSVLNLIDGQWHMYTMTYDGENIYRYVDGVLRTEMTQTISGTITGANCKFLIGHYGSNTSYHSTQVYFNDARIYATALDADAIHQLYEVGAKIDNKQNIHTFELVEANSKIQITKQGQVKCNELEEDEKTKFYQADQIIETNEIIET